MNFRRSTVKEHHPQTFEWVFQDRLPKNDHHMEFDDTESETDSASTVTSFSGSPVHSPGADKDEMIDNFDRHADGTSRSWDSFVDWLHTSDKTYWVSGKPGSGKSTLMLFLLRDFRTQYHLNEWRPDTLVLSHFLLSSGHLLQRNTRGIYCSLLHQMLVDDFEHDGFLLSLVASRFPRILSKDVPDDWAQWELKEVTLEAMKHSKRAICVFIDGLDELVASEIEDGHLWSLLRSLERIPKLKLCLSSRPEPSFRDHFDGAPKLQMQFLTNGDIRRYATEFLTSSIPLKNRQAQRFEVSNFIQIISDRANGVFLWVYLVLKRLRKGLTNGDTMAVLNRRLEETPKELHDLFQDMWGRLGEDAEISEYLTLAARYFHLVNTAKSCPVGYSDSKHSPTTTMELMLATNRGIIRDILEGNEDQVTAKRIHTACDAIVQSLDTCCAGLLECRTNKSSFSYSSPDSKDEEAVHYTLGVDFAHRSAQDFLFTTLEGAKILSHNSSTLEDQLVLLSQARMTIASLWRPRPIKNQLWRFIQYHLLSLSEDRTSQRVVPSQRHMQELVSMGGLLYRRSQLRDFVSSIHNILSDSQEIDFMLVLSTSTLVGQIPHYIEMLDQGTPSDYAGYLIRCICHRFATHNSWRNADKETKNHEARFATMRYLVNNGASVTFEGLAFDTLLQYLNQGPSHVQLSSAAVALINRLCNGFSHQQDHLKLAIVELMSSFVNKGANLTRPIVAILRRETYTSGHIYFDIPVTTIPTRGNGGLFFATTPGYLLGLMLVQILLLWSPRFSDLETATCGLLKHEAVSTAPPMLEALGIHSPTDPSAIVQANTSSSNDRTSVLLRSILSGIMSDAMPPDSENCWNEIIDIISGSGGVVSRVDFDKELIRRKFLVSKDDYMKGMPRLGAEQEALLVERMREEALKDSGNLTKPRPDASKCRVPERVYCTK